MSMYLEEYILKHKKISNVDKIKNILMGVLIFCAMLEMTFFSSVANLIGVVVSVLSCLIYFHYILCPAFYKLNPLLFLVSIMPFGFMYLPLPATLLDGNSISHDFFNPEITFILQFLYFIVFVFALKVASKLSFIHRGLNHLLNKVGFFYAPTFFQTYLLAAFGWIFQYLKLISQFSGEGVYVANFGTYSMFSVFIYAPLVNFFRDLMGDKPCSKTEKVITWFYFVFLSLSMVATNSRGAILSPTLIILLCFFIKRIVARGEMYFFTYRNIFLTVLLFLLVSGPFNDMAYAMLMVRGERKNLDYNELFSSTLRYYNNKSALTRFKQIIENDASQRYSNKDWDESYVSNIFLQRFCNYRVVDATIYHALRAGIPNEKMRDDFMNRLIAMFPQPIVKMISPSFKKERYAYSPMDLLYSQSNKQSIHVSYIVGGDVGLGIATFGLMYFPLVFFVYVVQLLILANMVKLTLKGWKFSFFTLISVFGVFLSFQVGSGFISHVQYILWSCWWGLIWRLIPFRLLTIRWN